MITVHSTILLMKQGAKTVDTSLDTGERAQKNEMNLNYEGKDDEISETIPAIC